jgi:hypothetical protein
VQVRETEQDVSGIQLDVVLVQAAFGMAFDAVEEGPTLGELKDEMEVGIGCVGAITGDYVRGIEAGQDSLFVL